MFIKLSTSQQGPKSCQTCLFYLFHFFYVRPYGTTGDGHVHENPEWEKARQALASINKNQTSKTTQDNRATAEVCVLSGFHLFPTLV